MTGASHALGTPAARPAAGFDGRGWRRPRPVMRTRRGLGEHLARHLVFPAWVWCEHPGYLTARRQLERSQYFDPGQLRQLQQPRLARLLAYAGQHCPFYRERFRAAGWTPGCLPDDEAWRALPLVSRRDLQACGPDIEAAGFPPHRRIANQTSGSTDTPLRFFLDRSRLATRMAAAHRHNAWAGHQPGDWTAVLWGSPQEAPEADNLWQRSRERLLYRTVSLNTASVEPPDWERFIRGLRRHRPRVLLAFARAAVAFAEYLRERGRDDLRFPAIITSAERLSPAHRQLIESTLGGRVFNRYGCHEFSLIASQCAAHSGLHVNAESLLVEVVPDPALPAPWGKVVITDLLNYAMPLIRYDIGDVARWAESACACGRGLPTLADVACRTNEYLLLPGGRVVAGPALNGVLAGIDAVRQAQFVQRPDRAVTLRVVPGPGYGAGVRRQLRARLEPHLRGAVPLRIEEVDVIPSQPSGKFLWVVQEAPAVETMARGFRE